MKSKWAAVRDYVNSKEIGHQFTRSDLILFGRLNGIIERTVDCERRKLTNSGFLKYIARGRYELIKKTPEGLTTTELWLLHEGDTLQYLERVAARKERENKI
jgi:hypothetical protein